MTKGRLFIVWGGEAAPEDSGGHPDPKPEGPPLRTAAIGRQGGAGLLITAPRTASIHLHGLTVWPNLLAGFTVIETTQQLQHQRRTCVCVWSVLKK